MAGERVKELRERRGWTQEELGAATGFTRSAICRIESGERHLTAEAAIRLARLLKVPVRELLAAGEPRP